MRQATIESLEKFGFYGKFFLRKSAFQKKVQIDFSEKYIKFLEITHFPKYQTNQEIRKSNGIGPLSPTSTNKYKYAISH